MLTRASLRSVGHSQEGYLFQGMCRKPMLEGGSLVNTGRSASSARWIFREDEEKSRTLAGTLRFIGDQRGAHGRAKLRFISAQ